MNRNKVWIFFVIFCFAAFQSRAVDPEAIEWNSRGFREYKEKNYTLAREYFSKALIIDDSYIFAHHNYACVLALTYNGKDDEVLLEIIHHLGRTLTLDRKRMEKILSDSDLDNVRDAILFREFILSGKGLYLKLSYRPAGDYTPGYYFTFYPDGKAVLTTGIDARGGPPKEKPDWEGRYALMGEDIVIYLKNYHVPNSDELDGARAFRYEIKPRDDFIWGKVRNGIVEDIDEPIYKGMKHIRLLKEE